MDHHGRIGLLSTYIQYQCRIPHAMCNSAQNSPTYETSLTRSSSNPDLEISQQLSPRGIDRVASMRSNMAGEPTPIYNNCQRILYEELAVQWGICNGRSRDQSMQNAWFLFDLIIKSMIEHLAHTGSLDAPRRLRFSQQFMDDIVHLVNCVTSDIISHANDGDIRRAHKLNAGLAFFFFDLVSIVDRGFVMQLLRTYTKQVQAKISSMQDPAMLFSLKVECVRIMCSHEHYVPLNLPFATPFMTSGASVSPSPSVTSSTSQNSFLSGPPASQERVSTFAELSSEYRQHHYLTGLVLTDLATVLLEMQ